MARENLSFSRDDPERLLRQTMMESLALRTTTLQADSFPSFRASIRGESAEGETAPLRLRSSFAVGFFDQGDDEKTINRKENIRAAFNSPLRPFVLATTSIGQEGLDFHLYCRTVMHWNLPSNPIDLEQREGRINRYKCLAIRQNVARRYGSIAFPKDTKDIWERLFQAARAEKRPGQSDLVPFWCFGPNQEVKIRRLVPMFPLSRDEASYERLIRILSLYRLTLGQARQEELLEYLLRECDDLPKLKELFIDLSPFSRAQAARQDGAPGGNAPGVRPLPAPPIPEAAAGQSASPNEGTPEARAPAGKQGLAPL